MRMLQSNTPRQKIISTEPSSAPRWSAVEISDMYVDVLKDIPAKKQVFEYEFPQFMVIEVGFGQLPVPMLCISAAM